ncbi:branched-chain amino acid ABC transporter permease [Stella sp.]|uniref:branched-chain amino acid ABC transporter permease n=1 Tax=Stella sp. TaxID=2912054 RepID=UPI0035B46C48
MHVYLLQTLNGIGIGMIYFLIAVGLTIIFGILRFVNFAHGAFYLVGAYLAFYLIQLFDSFWLALLVSPLVVAALAWVLDRILFHRIYHMSHDAHILVTVGIALMFQETVMAIWGPVPQHVPIPTGLDGIVVLGDFVYPTYRLFVIAVAAVLAGGLWLMMERSRIGALLRAGSEAPEMLSLLGVDTFRLFGFTFAGAAWLAAVAGTIAAPLRGVEPFMSFEALAIAFVVVVIGGLGNFTGALAGGLMIGIVQSLMSSIWPEGARLMIYVTMLAVILLRPYGLFGRA